MKYTKPLTKKDWKPRLAASSWTFIKDGVDDFRDGKPPPKDTDLLIKVQYKPWTHNKGALLWCCSVDL